MDASAHFRGKRVTVMGLGLLGRGVGDARYMAECGAELIVTDRKTREELAESVSKLESFKNVTFVLGEHRLEDFRNRDLILKAAGVPLDSPSIAEAKRNGIPVRMSADLFVEFARVPVIGVTGTRGKSTVAQMVYEILKEGRKKVLLGGNVRGVSTLALLKEVTPEHIAVLELDSWQLQGFGEARMSPQTSVFTTFYPDHLNYYGSTPSTTLGTGSLTTSQALDAYLADKANIFLSQGPEDTLILGGQCAPLIIEQYDDRIQSKTVVVDELKLPDTWTLRVPGAHNRYNAALALAAARAVGIEDAVSRRALEAFKGVPGRLELVAERGGVRVYNDTTATTPEATLAALSTLDASRTIVIAGGTDKNLELDLLIAKLKETKRLVLLVGSGTERVRKNLPDAPVYDSLAEAVADAFSHAKSGDNILFSPAFTSFGMFKNEYDRGDQFNKLVNQL